MQQLTQFFPTPAHTLPLAVAALTRLGDLNVAVGNELEALPTPDTNDVEALIQQIDDYWQAPSAQGKSRREMFIEAMEQGLRDELIVKVHEGYLDASHTDCIPRENADAPLPEAYTLHVQLSDNSECEIAGALVFINAQGQTLLVLPGVGAEGFASRTALGEGLVQWLNHEVLRHALFNNAELRDQQLIETISNDPQLYLDPFSVADLQLRPVTGKPFEWAFQRQLQKQRNDVRHAFNDTKQLTAAIAMQGVFGPGEMLEQREIAYWERQQRRSLPHWVKVASQGDLNEYQQRLKNYEESRTALLSALGGAASHEQYARMHLRARLASDLGYDLEPAQIMLTMQRRLSITGELYTTKRSLLHLGLYGLHPGDLEAESAFQTLTTLRLDGELLETSHPLLTTAYAAKLVDELDLGTTFREYQRTAYASEHNQQLMRDLTRRQVTAMAYAAKMQAHILPEDFALIEQIEADTTGQTTPQLHVQQIKLDDGEVLGGLLVFCRNDSQGRLERLVMFAADAPRAQCFQGFDNQTQLTHELVSWTTSPAMSGYLLKQVSASSRDNLEKRFEALRLKPQPSANYVQLIPRSHYHQALGQFVRQHVRVAAADHALRTPDWYLQANATQRKELLALEDAMAGATENYQTEPPTQAQDYEAYVHDRARQKINQLLGLAEGSVDPDQIIITTEREVLSYTRMLRNGYDDTLGLISSSADTQATFSGPAHVDLTPLTPQKVARSVHGKWLSDDYIKLVRETLLNADSSAYTYRRKAACRSPCCR
ncbi:type III effector HopAC1 [Paucimonas lemoignei]|nr:type III effector HopAC1 [Paucimonas lemoignei]